MSLQGNRCLAFTISRQSAQLPQRSSIPDPCAAPDAKTSQCEWQRSGIESLSKKSVVATLILEQTSHKHWSTRLVMDPVAYYAVISGRTILNQQIGSPLPRRMSTTASAIRSNMRACSSPFWFNCAATYCGWPSGTPRTFEPCLEKSNVGSPLHTTASGCSLELLLSKRLQLGASNLLRSRSSSCPGVLVCLSAPTNASGATSTPPRPWTAHRRRKCRPKRQTIVHLQGAKLEHRFSCGASKGLLARHLLFGTRAEHPRPQSSQRYVEGCR